MRIAATLLITFGLVAQGPWGVAFCADCDGGVSPESAIDGACAGSQACLRCPGVPCGVDFSADFSIDTYAEHVGCSKTLLDRDTAPPPDSSSAKRLVSRSGSDPAVASERFADSAARPADSRTVKRLSRGAPFLPSLGSVVLLL
jgi:hypothetical protein